MTDRWRYAVQMKNPTTGETQMVVVELSDAERRDALSNLAPCGGPDGMIVHGYAGRTAEKQNPGLSADSIERMVLH